MARTDGNLGVSHIGAGLVRFQIRGRRGGLLGEMTVTHSFAREHVRKQLDEVLELAEAWEELRTAIIEDQTEGACSCGVVSREFAGPVELDPDPSCPVHGSCPTCGGPPDKPGSMKNEHGLLGMPCNNYKYHTPSDQQTEEAPSDGSCPVDHATLTGRRGAGSVCPECGFDALAPSDQQGAG